MYCTNIGSETEVRGVCSSITVESKGWWHYWTTNFSWGRLRVVHVHVYIGAINLLIMIYIICTMIGSNTPYSHGFIILLRHFDSKLILTWLVGLILYGYLLQLLLSVFESLNCYLKNVLFGVISLCSLPRLGYLRTWNGRVYSKQM